MWSRRAWASSGNPLRGLAIASIPASAFAQDNIVATATLPRDLSLWGMFTTADAVVKAVLVGLAFASIVTWTVWLAKTIEIAICKRRVRAALNILAGVHSTLEGVERLTRTQGEVRQFLDAAVTELKLSAGDVERDGIKERIASRLERIEAAYGRRLLRGTGVLATIGSTAPFVGLFGTVWGIMNSFIGISKSQTTNLAVVAPGNRRGAARDRFRSCGRHSRSRDLQRLRALNFRISRAACRRLGRGLEAGQPRSRSPCHDDDAQGPVTARCS